MYDVKRKIKNNEFIYNLYYGLKTGLCSQESEPDGIYLRYSYDHIGTVNINKYKKKYCIISVPEQNNAAGTFELWMNMALRAMIAKADGYIPFIDMKNIKAKNWKGIRADKEINAWELFFRQYRIPISLEEIYLSNDYVSFTNVFSYGIWEPYYSMTNAMWTQYRVEYCNIGPKEELIEEAEKFIFPGKTLGITIRREMEWGNKIGNAVYKEWWGHHIRGSLQSYEKWIDSNLEKMGFQYFFLAVDDMETLEYFKKKYGNRCLYYQRNRRHLFKDETPISPMSKEFQDETKERMEMWYTNEKKYIIETIVLSRCDSLLGNPMGQETMARIMKEEYTTPINNGIFLEMSARL